MFKREKKIRGKKVEWTEAQLLKIKQNQINIKKYNLEKMDWRKRQKFLKSQSWSGFG